MDPLSASASVFAVLQLSATVIKYLKGVKGAGLERQRLLSEIYSINSLLLALHDQAEKEAEDDTVHQVFASLQSSNGPMEQIKDTLERLKSKLAPTKGYGAVAGSINWPFKRDEIKDLLAAIERQKTLFTLARQNDLIALSNAICGNVDKVHNQLVGLRERFLQLEENNDYNKFIAWLNAPDPWINQNKASKLRHKHTGHWFIESTIYKDWLQTAHSPLWLHGIPGCGKTILASTIVQNLLEYQRIHPRAAIIFYFFDFNDAAKQAYENLIRSLIKQLASQHNLASEQPHAPYTSWQEKYKEQSEDQLMSIFHHLLQYFEDIYLLVDALDECAGKEDLLRVMQQWTSWDDINLHAIFASRKERVIEEVLCCLCDDLGTVSIQSSLVDNDIREYVRARLRDDMRLKRWRKKPQMQQLIVDSLMEKANGMFRWAACQLDALGDCLTEAKLRKALHTLPPTLDETYARILSNIKEDYQDYAFLMLQWLCFSPRPLRLEELAEVVAVTSEEPWIHPEERLADPQDVLAICSTLITTESSPGGKEDIDPSIFYCQCRDRIDHSCMPLSCDCLWPYSSAYDLRMDYHKIHTDALQTYAHLAHFSVKEYLTSSRISANAGFSFKIYETDAHARMYSSCLAYLLHINRKDRTQPDLWLEYPLIFHATYHWHTHAQHVEQGQNHIPPLALKFLSNEENSFATWLAMSQELGPPLYHASRHGLWRSVQILLNRRVDVNAAGGRRDTAIKVAALYGHDRVVEMLIRNGANVNVEQGGPPLRAAVISGNRRVVWQLLENGADVKGPGDSDSGDCLELAVQRGDEHIVQMLLGHGTNINSWQSALKTAVMYDRIPAIRALLNHQFTSAQLRDQAIRAALTRAIRYTRASSVSLLLEHMHSQGVVIDDFGRTTLSYAAEVGETDILSMLMKHDHQYLQVADKYGRTLISYAAQSGDVAASQMLLKHSDQDIDLADARGRTPLSYAAGTGPEGLETVALLLANGRVHANSRDREGRTPLSYAVGSIISRNNVFLGGYQRHVRRMESQPDILKHQSLVKMFLEHDGTAFMIQDKYGWTPLSWAVQADHIHLVELLSPYGHRGLDQKGSDGKTPIANVLGRGSVKMLRLLSEHGVVDIKELSNDNRAWHRITQAASRGHTELVDLLLKSSSLDPRSQDITGRTLVSLAAELGNEETLKLLLSIDSSIVDLPDKTSRTPFSYVFSGDMNGSARRKAKLLLDTNAVSPDLPDENGRAPISYLAETADASLVQVLLDRNIDIERPDKRGRTPLSYALRKANDDKAVRLIFEKCTTGKNHADHAGRTPLSYAAERKWRGAIKFMLKSGFVEVNTPDKYGLTPLAYAEMAEEGRKSDGVRTSEVLRSYGAYRLDLEEPAPEGTDSHTEASGIADPERSALTTPSIEALSLAE